jgi:hypothetical protein
MDLTINDGGVTADVIEIRKPERGKRLENKLGAYGVTRGR